MFGARHPLRTGPYFSTVFVNGIRSEKNGSKFTYFMNRFTGVDDMFVIMACWDDLPATHRHLPLHERIGLMLKHGGVSITVTSVTDILAFIVGASTVRIVFASAFFYFKMRFLDPPIFRVILYLRSGLCFYDVCICGYVFCGVPDVGSRAAGGGEKWGSTLH